MSASVLIVDDDTALCDLLRTQIEQFGYRTHVAHSGQEGLEACLRVQPDLVLLDYEMPDLDGLQVLKQLIQQDPRPEVVMISAYSDSDSIVKAMKLGAENYLTKPIAMEDLRGVIDRLVGAHTEEADSLRGVIGHSEPMRAVCRLVHRVAPTRATVLIRGESGTGKEVIARVIHQHSTTPLAPFVTLDCTNIPGNLMESELFGHERGAFTDARTQKRGLLETADGGTVFMDELGLMPLDLQAKLLNVLETRRFRRVGGNEEIEVDVRILAATNENLEKAVGEGRFREDLFYRLNVVPVDLPPLRDREDDVLLIADHYLQWYTTQHGVPARRLAEDARALFKVYPWPGNVRELRNVIERAILMTDGEAIPASALSIDRRSGREADDAPPVLNVDEEGQWAVRFPPEGIALATVERQLIEAALAQTRGNVTRAAALLHLSRDTLRYRIAKYGG